MFGRKTGLLAAMTAALLMFGGCGNDGRVDEEKARNWYNEMTRENGGSAVNDTDADGYGNYTGGPNWGTDNTERNTYGMRTDNSTNSGTTLGQDIRNAWDDVKNSMTGDGSNGGANNGSNGGNAGGNTTTGGTGGSR